MSTRRFVLAVFALVAFVVGCSTPDPQPPASVTRDALVGTWRHQLPNHEQYELVLFDSGIVAFIHANEKLPISRSFGRWSFDDGTLDLRIVGTEGGEGAEFPLANRLYVQRVAGTLSFEFEGARTTWSAHDRYGAARDGADDRRAKDERDWAQSVERAEQAATATP